MNRQNESSAEATTENIALSGAAVLGAPLAHDFCVISLSDRLAPWEMIEKRLACAAMGISAWRCTIPPPKGGRITCKGGSHPVAKRQGGGYPLRRGAQHWPHRPAEQPDDTGRAGTHHRGYVHHGVHRQQRHPPGQRVDGNAAGYHGV